MMLCTYCAHEADICAALCVKCEQEIADAEDLRAAIREIRNIVTEPGPVGVNGWNTVVLVCDRALTKPEGEK